MDSGNSGLRESGCLLVSMRMTLFTFSACHLKSLLGLQKSIFRITLLIQGHTGTLTYIRNFNLDFRCYADDTQIYLSTKSSPSQILVNLLKFNADKAELLISIRSILTRYGPISLTINDGTITPCPLVHNLLIIRQRYIIQRTQHFVLGCVSFSYAIYSCAQFAATAAVHTGL